MFFSRPIDAPTIATNYQFLRSICRGTPDIKTPVDLNTSRVGRRPPRPYDEFSNLSNPLSADRTSPISPHRVIQHTADNITRALYGPMALGPTGWKPIVLQGQLSPVRTASFPTCRTPSPGRSHVPKIAAASHSAHGTQTGPSTLRADGPGTDRLETYRTEAEPPVRAIGWSTCWFPATAAPQ